MTSPPQTRTAFGTPQLQRRQLAIGLASAGLLTLVPAAALATPSPLVRNVTGLYSVAVARIETPRSASEVSRALRAWPGRVAVGGGHYSMGGQVAIEGGLQLDMRQMKQLVWLRPDALRVRVQAGMRWRDLQDLLDPLDLAAKTMQSFANFTIGGAVSVNCHGRYVGHGPVGHSVQALQLVLADGQVVECSRSERAELFGAAIGGYGAVGVITEVELELARNVRIERVVQELSLADYPEHFQSEVLGRGDSLLHNADLMAPHFDRPVSVTWRRSDKPLTEPARLVPRNARYGLEQNLIWAMTELPGGAQLRQSVIHPLLSARPAVKWLNHEASLDVAELEPRTRRMSTYVLQEFFIPPRHFLGFAKGMAKVLKAREVMALNVSIRHAPADTLSCLPWAREEVFCFVLYFKQRSHAAALERVGLWTRELIELCLAHEGRYYLPYQPHATRAQFERAYPEAQTLGRIKRDVDPEGKLSNQLWARYL
ncbi:MAG: FAD-binding oxidoreductase [Burkholderiaceae bacterium]|nr:FAD-binding oxidoreductase [Burkholderiaceae bacterium]